VTSMRENRKEKMPNHKARSYDFWNGPAREFFLWH
jgi:hypothetical protein